MALKKLFLYTFLSLFLCLSTGAQTPFFTFNSPVTTSKDSLSTEALFQSLSLPNENGGWVSIKQDPKIPVLLDTYRKAYDKSTIPGFRIRIFSASGNTARQQAAKAMQVFSGKYPEVTPYLSYDEPYFKIYVGDFRTKTDALRFHKRIANEYPNAFISADYITVHIPILPTETPQAESEETFL